jgi:hypothetical protein
MNAPVRLSVWAAAAAALLAAAGCTRPAVQDLGLPEGHVAVRSKGVEVYCRKGEEPLAESVAAALADYRQKARPQVEKLSTEFRTIGKVWSRASADASKLEAAHKELLAMVQPLLAEPGAERSMQQLHRQLVATVASMTGGEFERAWSGAYGGQRAKLVSLEDVKADRIPFLSWVGGRDNPYQWSVHSTRNLDSGRDNLVDQKGRMVELNPWTLAMPVVREDLAGKDPAVFLNARLESLTSLTGPKKDNFLATLLGAARVKGKPPEAQLLVSMLLHEEAELTLVYGLKIKEPLARWFHDGLATALAHEAIRRAYGRTDRDLYYGPENFETEFKEQRAGVNLLAWPREDVRTMWLSAEEEKGDDAYYAWSAHELRGLAERHGWGKVTRLLEVLRAEQNVTTDTICAKIKEITGEDFMVRLQAFCPKDALSLDELKAGVRKAAAENKAEEALALAERLAASYPRDPLGHLMIGAANGYLWGDERFGRSSREFTAWWYLSDTRERSFAGLDNDKARFVQARFIELAWPQRPEAFKEGYIKALAVNPQYRPARDRLKALGVTDAEIERLLREATRKPNLFDRE